MLPKPSTPWTVAVALWALTSEAALFGYLEASADGQDGVSFDSLFLLLGELSGRVILIMTIFVIAIFRDTSINTDTIRITHVLSAAAVDAVFWVAVALLVRPRPLGAILG